MGTQKMPKLLSHDRNQVLLQNLRIASSFRDRLIGLMGQKSLAPDQALWIERCHSIHTFFMRFSIDCVFVSRDHKIVSIVENVKPYRMTWIQKNAADVIELPAGRARELNFKVGEQLHVGT